MRLGLRDLQEIRDGYYKVCVEVDKRYFDDSIEINFKNKLLKLTEVKIYEDYSPKDEFDYLEHIRYVGCVKNGGDIKLHFQIEHKVSVDNIDEQNFYYTLCRRCYVENISTIIRDINQTQLLEI